jgi:hypothetical protein
MPLTVQWWRTCLDGRICLGFESRCGGGRHRAWREGYHDSFVWVSNLGAVVADVAGGGYLFGLDFFAVLICRRNGGGGGWGFEG